MVKKASFGDELARENVERRGRRPTTNIFPHFRRRKHQQPAIISVIRLPET